MTPTRRALARPSITRWAAAVAVLVASPSLFYGLVIDDHLQRQAALGTSKLYSLGPFNLFAFVPGEPKLMLRLMDHGFGAWWSDLHARVVFLRPISSALLWLDYRFLRDSVLIHAHSILWYAAAVALAGTLYRRWIATPWIAGLAALMFAVDPTHGLPVGWIAQRNALVAGTFSLAALLLHDRARREERPALDAAACVCLGLGLFSAEAALGVLPYLVAHAWFLDRRKLRGLVPFVPPLAVWVCVYKLGDYGARGSYLYVDPIQEPLSFIRNVVVNGPLLVATELGLPGADFYLFLSPFGKVALVGVAVFLSVAFVAALRPLLARDPATRFFVGGAVLSVIPSCAVFPGGRVLFLASFGFVGALAQLLAAWRDRDDPRRGWAKPLVYVAAPFHVYVAPALFWVVTLQMNVVERVLVRLSDGVLDVPELDRQRLVVVNPPDATFLGYLALIRADRGWHAPATVLAMAAGVRPLELSRTSPTALVLSSPVALVQPGTDLLVRDTRPFDVGDGVSFPDVSIEITRVNAEGWPTEARFEFARSLEDPNFCFMQWQNQTLKPLVLPRVGERVAFPAQEIQLF